MTTQTISTEVMSCGSKWAGEAPDTIDTLWELFETHELMQFTHATALWGQKGYLDRGKRIAARGHYQFLGNFVTISHVFNIDTNDPELIKRLRNAIAKNKRRARSGGFSRWD